MLDINNILKSFQKKQLIFTYLVIVITILLRVLSYYDMLEKDKYPIYTALNNIMIVYLIITRLLSLKKKYKLINILSSISFVFICIILYYSINIVDIIVFCVALYMILETMICTDLLNKNESNNNEITENGILKDV